MTFVVIVVVLALALVLVSGRLQSTPDYLDAQSKLHAAADNLRDEVLKPFAAIVNWLMNVLSRGTN